MAQNGIATCTIAGNITRDGELNESGLVASFGVAVNRNEKNSAGEYGDVAHFFDCKVLGKRAAGLAPYLTKGQKVTVQGDLVHERWETADGQKRSVVRIIAREVVLGSSLEKPTEEKPDREAETGGW